MTAPRDWRIGQQRGLLKILGYASPKYDNGRHLLVVCKCRCGDERVYRLDHVTGTPRPCCPECAKAKKIGNTNAKRKRLGRKHPPNTNGNTPYPIEISVVNETPTAQVASPDPISEETPPQKPEGSICSDPARCVHGFHLADRELAEGLRIARTNCSACRQIPNKRVTARLTYDWNTILSKYNLAAGRGTYLTDLDATPTAKRQATHFPDAADLGRAGDTLFYKGGSKKIEQIKAAHERDEGLGGKKRTAAGMDRVKAYQNPNVDADYDSDHGDDVDLDGLPPIQFEHELDDLTVNPDDRELESLAIYDEIDESDDEDQREELTWWVRLKRIYKDEFEKPLPGSGKQAVKEWIDAADEEEILQDFWSWVRAPGVNEFEKPLLVFVKCLEIKYGEEETIDAQGAHDEHNHN